MRTVVNGRAIDHYKDFDVLETGLAVPKAEPLYRSAISNGYSPDDFIVDANLVLYLPLWLLKGSTFKSVDRYGHSCTTYGPLWKPAGRSFDGLDDYILGGTNTIFDFGDGSSDSPLTIEIWVDLTDLTAPGSLVSKYGMNRQQYELNLTTTTTYFVCRDQSAGAYIGRGAPISLAKQHIVVTYDATEASSGITIYVNGSAVDDEDVESGTYVAMEPFVRDLQIGRRRHATTDAWQLPLKGTIGEIRIYTRALSAVEVSHNYNATRWRYR